MSGEKTVQLLDLTTGKDRLVGKHEGAYSLAYSPDGKWVALSSSDGTARLWDVAGKRPGRILKLIFRGTAGQAKRIP